MFPVALAFMAVGSFISAKNNFDAAQKQADAAERNAEFFKEQADFAQKAGDRQLMLQDRSQKILYGEQASAFAKAGVDTAFSANFLASEMNQGQAEAGAILDETNLNVRLASFRASEATAQADGLRKGASNRFWGDFLGGAGSAMAATSGGGKAAPTSAAPTAGAGEWKQMSASGNEYYNYT